MFVSGAKLSVVLKAEGRSEVVQLKVAQNGHFSKHGRTTGTTARRSVRRRQQAINL